MLFKVVTLTLTFMFRKAFSDFVTTEGIVFHTHMLFHFLQIVYCSELQDPPDSDGGPRRGNYHCHHCLHMLLLLLQEQQKQVSEQCWSTNGVYLDSMGHQAGYFYSNPCMHTVK